MVGERRVRAREPEEVARRLRELEQELKRGAPLAPDEAFVYVALGASDAVGIGSQPTGGYVSIITSRLRQRFPYVRLANLGIAGATLPEIVRQELPTALALRPHLVTLMTGGNDVIRGVDPAEFRHQLSLLLDRLLPITRRLVVATVPNMAMLPIMDTIPDLVLPFGDKRGYVSARCLALNRVAIEEASRRGARLVHVTMSDVLSDGNLVAADGFHPSDAGYRRLADRFWEQIEPLLPL